LFKRSVTNESNYRDSHAGLLFFGWFNIVFAVEFETIRPSGTYDTNAKWANNSNAWDNSLTTAADLTGGPPNQSDSWLYVGAVTSVATDAWDAPSQSWDSGTLYCTYSSDGWDGNDLFSVEIRNGADSILATLESPTASAVTKTTKNYVLSGGELSNQTDLRCVGIYNRAGGQDTGASYIYEVWQDGTFTIVDGVRRRLI